MVEFFTFRVSISTAVSVMCGGQCVPACDDLTRPRPAHSLLPVLRAGPQPSPPSHPLHSPPSATTMWVRFVTDEVDVIKS